MRKKFRKGVFMILYSLEKDKPKYLLLKRKLHWKGWEFVKGKIEPFETKKKTAKREAKEETGLDIFNIKKHPYKGEYLYKKMLKDRPGLVGQTFSLYSGEVKYGKVNVDKLEHSGFKWADYKSAMKSLTYKNQKDSLKIVNNWLLEKLK